jgi:CRISPR system Cascade subunit CasE
MHLSRLLLNPLARTAARDLGDAQAMHRTVMSAFPDGAGPSAREKLCVLWRVDRDEHGRRIALLVQSRIAPDWSGLPAGHLAAPEDGEQNPATTSLEGFWEALQAGATYPFRLRANATRKVTKLGPDGKPTKNSVRVPVRGEEGRLAWLARLAAKNGFAIVEAEDGPELRILEEPRAYAGRSGPRATFAAVRYEGRLRVTEVDVFRQRLAVGIGPAKAFGFGLLSIARAP